ncbi:hypothetical protein [Escherichia coli]|uniref:hypothetical protein n=1 Tax=Escherichia coli TaxID=562 RepID=UPI0012FFB1A9|nr:hypothetical protein [Escherichia coli]ELD5690760.1 hypothetical protein [Escherichia coli]ELO7645603.1 hypothetical protein [Escherichia coli]
MAITSAFQADDVGSIPAGRSIEDYGDCMLSIFLRYLSSVKINTQQLFMLALAMIVIGFLGTCLFIYYIFVDN